MGIGLSLCFSVDDEECAKTPTTSVYGSILPSFTSSPYRPDSYECDICMEYVPHGNWARLGCNHYFCKVCIDRWYKINPSCPMCRDVPRPAHTVLMSTSLPLPGRSMTV